MDACKSEQACIPLETGDDGLVELARIHPRAYLRKDSHQFPRAYNVSNPQRGAGAGRVTRVEVISDWWAKRPSKIIVTDATGDLVLAMREWPKMDTMICGNDGKSKCSCKYSAEREGGGGGGGERERDAPPTRCTPPPQNTSHSMHSLTR
jgi:hypothetical protein